jgi:hypothetical protein
MAIAPNARAEEGDKRARLAVDIDYSLALGEGDTDHGLGGALRFGYLLNLAATSITPEVGLAYHGFDGTLSPSIYTAFVGGRATFSGVLAPGLYARLGIAHSNDDAVSRTVPMIGAGLTLDFSPMPVLDVGLHTGYENLFGSDEANAFDWWTFGGHVGVAF